ncbi:uncharacterized protein M421DRAFT_419198 [Didymella exigua CBS 183.55]|uniref:Uncharacterized protein n=1 Tax=Didymella exigua CBS 183.55 TaxID=1150837 RepID=A0A6A5RT42_9PLEO|nr:uncharacterized protein M421DRAFT_419198 [Didymella exigua CBS 183.55]KAF1930158.1 hypothetical protein M421DRAFT_419198 [Didymella exigua CBS 183.55]
MTLQPALSPGPGPSQPDHSPSPQLLPPGRLKFDDEKSAAVSLRCFAGGEELRNLLLPLECTADHLRQVRQPTRLQLCPRVHPGQTANNGVTGERRVKGVHPQEDEATKQRCAGDPGFSVCERTPWFAGAGGHLPAPSRGRYDSRPSLTGDVSSRIASTGEHHPAF